ncbi:hypothetical protein [Microbacterium paulum]
MRTPEGRSQVLREVTRQGLARNVAAVEESTGWQIYRAVLAIAQSDALGEDTRALREGLGKIEERFLDRMSEVFTQLASAFHRVMVPGITARDLAVVAAAIVEGVVEHQRLVDPEIGRTRAIQLPCDAEQSWNLPAIAIYSQFVLLTTETGQPD